MYQIRRYTPEDRQAVWSLVADTAFFGAPVEAFWEDRALYSAMFAEYYTDYEPERLWVAEADGVVVGYVMGCGDTRRRVRIWLTRVLPLLLRDSLQGCYRVGPKTLRYLLRSLLAALGGGQPKVPLGRFPGHLHIGVAASTRGQGIGRALLEAALAQFWATGVRGVHLETTDHNEVACHLYESVGFRLLDARRTRLWRGLVEGDVQNRAYGMSGPGPVVGRQGWRERGLSGN